MTANGQISQIDVLPGRPIIPAIYQAGGSNYASFLFGLSFDVDDAGHTDKAVIAQWQLNGDGVGTSLPVDSLSTNEGMTFGPFKNIPPVLMNNSIKLRDGTIVALPFSSGNHTFSYYISTNNASSWTLFTNGTTSISFDFHRGILEENDGTIYAIGYAGSSVWLMKSANKGTDWTPVTPGQPVANGTADGRVYNEATLARCANGSWLAIFRVQTTNSPANYFDVPGLYLPMRYSRSTNEGLTWSPPALLPGLTTALGVDPQLVLMPDGILALSWGWPDATDKVGHPGRSAHAAFSPDGNGISWQNDTTTFTNKAGVSESTGYTFGCSVGQNRFLQFGDTGVNWSYASANPSPNPFTVWGKYLDIVPANVNRIDLLTKYEMGLIAVSTALNYADSMHPEARISGAFDGSVDYWSGAFGSGNSGSYSIILDRPYDISALGLCLYYDNPESANIYFSLDGTNWGRPVKAYTWAVHNAIDYTTFPGPIRAKYVRVDVHGYGPLICLNEIELYETADTFENAAVGTGGNPNGPIPPGYTWAGTSATQYGFSVREGATNGYQSTRALQLWDTSSSWIAGIRKASVPSGGKCLSFRIKPQGFASDGGILFNLESQAGINYVKAFSLAVRPDGSIQYNHGTEWQNLAAASSGTVPLNAWSLLRIQAVVGRDEAQVYVNDVFFGNAGINVDPSGISNLCAFSFGSSGVAAVGDQTLFDDVAFTDFSVPVLTGVLDSAGNIIVGISNGVPNSTCCVISSSSLSVPVSDWPIVSTNQFDADGKFSITNQAGRDSARFYSGKLP